MYGKLISDTHVVDSHQQHTPGPWQGKKDSQTLAAPGLDEKKGSYVPNNLPGCLELDEDFY